jgi:hypothetical protein
MREPNETAAGRQEDLDIGRRNLLKMAGVGAAALSVASAAGSSALAQSNEAWDKTFPKSESVDHEKVTFTNRYGITLSGDLYLPANRGDARLPALALSGPFGAVKEQSSGLYAQTMANAASSPSPSIRPSSVKAAAGLMPSLRPTSTPRTSWPPSTISVCTPRLTANASASWLSAAFPAWH